MPDRPAANADLTPAGRAAALVASSAAFLELKDTNALAVALPILASEFGVRPLSTSLLITAYIVVLGVFIPLSGWLADRFGARRVFQFALGLFIAGSALCALSRSFDELVIARIVQALGGSFMTPVARLILVRCFPREELVRVMAWFGIPMMLGPLLSPLIGGLFAGYASWTWIFWMNLPLGAAILVLSFKYIPAPPKLLPPKLDRLSSVLLMAGLSLLMVGLEVISSRNIHPATGLILLAGGTALLAGYAVRAARRSDAPLDLGLLRFRSFRLILIGTLLFSMATTMLPFLVPILLQTAYHYDTMAAGFVAVTGVVGGLTGRLCIGWAIRVLPPVPFMMGTVAAAGVSAASLAAIDARADLALFVLALMSCGFFGALQATGLTAMAYAEISDERAGAATSFVVTVQQLSMAVGVAFAAILVEKMAHAPGGDLTSADFAIGFALSGALSLATTTLYPRIPRIAIDKFRGTTL